MTAQRLVLVSTFLFVSLLFAVALFWPQVLILAWYS